MFDENVKDVIYGKRYRKRVKIQQNARRFLMVSLRMDNL
ncbi:hypothetical protein BN130_2970 [Cronobacter malonaticus 507]|nr:hypothetical protein BN130_2970 [Cronobacter malonaticus 507]